MATYNKFNSFVEALAEKQHNLQSEMYPKAVIRYGSYRRAA